MLKKIFLFIKISLFLICFQIYCKEIINIKKIKIEGLQTIKLQNIISKIPDSINRNFSLEKSDQIIKNLYNTKYFSNIIIFLKKKNILIIKVKELPIIQKINIKGNTKISTFYLKKFFKTFNITPGNILNPNKLSQIKRLLLVIYSQKKLYGTQVFIKKILKSKNQIMITFFVKEGKIKHIQSINFIGNNFISSKILKDQMVLQESGILSFFNKKDIYSNELLNFSIKNIYQYYMNHGYLDFNLLSIKVLNLKNNKNVIIQIHVLEGEKYIFDNYTIQGDIVFTKQRIKKIIKIKKGDIFSREKIIQSIKLITSALGDIGYTFPEINIISKIDKKKKIVRIIFNIKKGKRLYIRYISFIGNKITNDNVLRKQIHILEGEIFNEKYIKYSEENIQKTYPFIINVKHKIKKVKNTLSKIDIDFYVKEKNANTVNANLGFSNLEGLIIGGNINIPNLFGTGNTINLGGSFSKPIKSLDFSYIEPYSVMGIKKSINIQIVNINSRQKIINFARNLYKANIEYAMPINNNFYISTDVGISHIVLLNNNSESETIKKFFIEYGKKFTNYNLGLSIIYNSTNKFWFPNKGTKLNLSYHFSMPGSTILWYKIYLSNVYYFLIKKDYVFFIENYIKYGSNYGFQKKDGIFPIYDNFFGGGWDLVRGYATNSLGPKDTIIDKKGNIKMGDPIGGNLSIVSRLNLCFPVPFIKDSSNMRMGVFLDAGNIYSTKYISTIWDKDHQPKMPNLNNLKYSFGVFIQWISPFGLLSLSFADPFNAKKEDSIQYIQFSIGVPFQ